MASLDKIISAGTTFASVGKVIFSNSPSVSFGADGQTITASINAALTNQVVNSINGSTGIFSFNTGSSLSSSRNGNSITWGLASDITTALQSTGNYLTTAAQSNQVVNSINGSTGTFSFNTGSSLSSSRVGNAITFGLASNITTALQSTGAYLTTAAQSNQVVNSINGSTGIFSFNTGSSLSSSRNGNSITWGLASDITTALQSTGAYLTTAAQSNQVVNSINGSTGIFSFNTGSSLSSSRNGNSITWGLASNITTALQSTGNYLTTARASTDAVGLNTAQTNVTWTVNSSGISLNASGYAGTGTTFAGANISGSITNNSVGLNLSLSVAAPGGGAYSAGISNLGSTAGTSGLVGNEIVFVGTNGLLLSQSVNGGSATVTFDDQQKTLSSYENFPMGVLQASQMTWNGASISHGAAFLMPQAISFSFLRLGAIMTTNQTTIATMASATATAQGGLFSTLNAVIYSVGVGASSRSLQYVTSGQALYSFTQQISITDSTRGSYSLGITQNAQGAQTNLTTQYSVSATNYSFTTNQIATLFSSARWLDIPLAGSLPYGNYWLIAGLSSSTSSAGAAGLAALTNCNVRYSAHYGASILGALAFGVMGSANLTSIGADMGAGSFSTAGGGTTNSIPMSAISSSASNARMYFQFLRSA